ncbi:protein stum homolog isoform X3 [Lingula anatina]|uniref:Protein stum homolog isoform X3 n=1 Tax=Lingula anatina TaxID=7574 RepID=A0A2R2MME3_LINAN|nr:protein stum homolog isoform X3 [Lingula anatina]|eukprot:XP_023931393.1 protein stum homolog isoform X3 [Lingula anatina]
MADVAQLDVQVAETDDENAELNNSPKPEPETVKKDEEKVNIETPKSDETKQVPSRGSIPAQATQPNPVRDARRLEVLRVEEKQGPFRSAIPSMPLPLAIILCILNVVAPGIGTLISSFTVFCGCQTRSSKPIFAFFYNLLAALLQLATTIIIVGWIWSILWGMTMVQIAGQRNDRRMYGDVQ